MYVMLALSRVGYQHAVQNKVKMRIPHYAVLASLAEFGPDSQQSISQRIGFDKSDVTKIINALEAEQLVERKEDKEDRRRHWVTLTAKGKKQLELSDKEIVAAMKDFLGALSSAEYEQLLKLLRKAMAAHDPRF
jgi:DNA-binding MarR family transcriptional regulator